MSYTSNAEQNVYNAERDLELAKDKLAEAEMNVMQAELELRRTLLARKVADGY